MVIPIYIISTTPLFLVYFSAKLKVSTFRCKPKVPFDMRLVTHRTKLKAKYNLSYQGAENPIDNILLLQNFRTV